MKAIRLEFSATVVSVDGLLQPDRSQVLNLLSTALRTSLPASAGLGDTRLDFRDLRASVEEYPQAGAA
jgi:hypothetical protein